MSPRPAERAGYFTVTQDWISVEKIVVFHTLFLCFVKTAAYDSY